MPAPTSPTSAKTAARSGCGCVCQVKGAGVVSKYSPLSEHEDYDWAIVPFEEYMHGLASADFAPMIGTPKLQSAIERYNFRPLFSVP